MNWLKNDWQQTVKDYKAIDWNNIGDLFMVIFCILLIILFIWAFIPSVQDKQAEEIQRREQRAAARYKITHPAPADVKPLTAKEQQEMYKMIKEIKHKQDYGY